MDVSTVGATIDDPESALDELREWAAAMVIRFAEVFRPILPTLVPADPPSRRAVTLLPRRLSRRSHKSGYPIAALISVSRS
jgi:hypothetical protein